MPNAWQGNVVGVVFVRPVAFCNAGQIPVAVVLVSPCAKEWTAAIPKNRSRFRLSSVIDRCSTVDVSVLPVEAIVSSVEVVVVLKDVLLVL